MSPSIARYLNVQQAYHPSIAADGRRVAFLSTITGVPQVWQVAIPALADALAWPDQRTFETERVLGVWTSPVAGDGRLVFARDAGGNENAQLFVLEEDGTERALTSGYDAAMHTFGAWSADGKQLLFAANRRDPAIFDLYLQSLDGEAKLVWQHDRPGYLFRQQFAPDGRHVAVVRMMDSFRHDVLEIDLQTGTARQLNQADEATRYLSIWYDTDGQALLVNTDQAADFLYIGRLDLTTLELEPLVTADWDIEQLQLAPDGRSLAYVVNEDGTSRLAVYDLVSQSTRTAPPFDAVAGIVGWPDGRLSWSADGRQLACSFTNSIRTCDIFVWDLPADAVQLVTRSSHGGIARASFVAPELVRYPTFDGRTIPAWWYQPTAGQGPCPTVVVVHGGPEAQFVPFFNFFVQYLLQHGYAVLAPNVRGSTGYGKAYSHLDDVRLRMDSVADLAHAVYWLRTQTGVDAGRIAVYGGSYGGFMVLATLTHYPDLWAAGVDIVGISNLATFLENTSAYRRKSREAEYGSLADDRAFLEEIAPINHVERITAPLMVIHGANDPRVPLSEAEQLVEAVEARDVPVELLVFSDEGHGIVKLKNKLVVYPAIMDFLDMHLMGEG